MSTPPQEGARILLVEDEELLAEALAYQLQLGGFQCDFVRTLAAARKRIHSDPFDLVLLDVQLPDGSGLDLLQEIYQQWANELPVVVLTSFANVEDAVQALKNGAADYLEKPDNPQQAVLVLERVLEQAEQRRRLDHARQRDSHAVPEVTLLGESQAMRKVHLDLSRIARLGRGGSTQPTVLILGETGCGKDIVARALHRQGAANERPFVHVDCTSLPETLIESELFGHEKGAFTQADRSRTGLLEAAENGTVFLNEIGELPLPSQARLLTVLDRRRVRRLGSDRERPMRACIIAATNRPLRDMVEAGRFRADLYYRLQVLTLELPPLRDRGDDVLLLARHFADTVAHRFGMEGIVIQQQAEQALKAYGWPGNVRELKHVMERAVLLHPGGEFPLSLLAAQATAVGQDSDLNLRQAERRLILRALDQSGHNVTQAAQMLGLSRGSLRGKLAKHGIAGPKKNG